MNTQNRDWLSRKEAAAHLTTLGFPTTAKVLNNLATRGKGPPYRRIRRKATVYNRSQLEAWAIANMETVIPGRGA